MWGLSILICGKVLCVRLLFFFSQLERLDADLKNYRHNVIKESIRRGYDALGDHHLDCGDLKLVIFILLGLVY